jgi:predicted small secreted protein
MMYSGNACEPEPDPTAGVSSLGVDDSWETLMGKSKVISLLMALALAFSVSGCNTVKGAGKDVQKAGKAVERAADKAQN